MLKEISKDYIVSTRPNASFNISTGSQNNYYQIRVPYQVTYEYCSGTGSDDYMNAVTLSEGEFYYARDSFEGHDRAFKYHPLHSHDYYEIMIVLEGTVTQRIEDVDYKYPAGTCCLINRGIRHSENFDSEARLLFIGLSVSMISELFAIAEHSSFYEEKLFLNSSMCKFLSNDLEDPDSKAYLDFIPSFNTQNSCEYLTKLTTDLLQVLMFPHFGSTFRTRNLLCEFLHYLSDQNRFHCTEVKMGMRNDQLLFNRIEHLMEEKDGRISRSELEMAINYSGDYLNRIVNKYTGMCLYDYGMTFCLKKAAYCLEHTNDSITSIAQMLQFSNRTHFYSLFEKQYHMTPNEYRKKNR